MATFPLSLTKKELSVKPISETLAYVEFMSDFGRFSTNSEHPLFLMKYPTHKNIAYSLEIEKDLSLIAQKWGKLEVHKVKNSTGWKLCFSILARHNSCSYYLFIAFYNHPQLNLHFLGQWSH
ncbi:hypothetical protein JCM31447_310300 [Fluviispira sanaruensis]|uniref:Uncharacterized protein n=1 Tax=Fluviispira sanaruensis TaxID=2493639 RepID=A0A4P2VG01_FLUSA|nr:hypothetical protein JCM31447_310300 [Fluviispira sanaruensis]